MIKLLIIHCDGTQKGGNVNVLRYFLNHLNKNHFEPLLVFLKKGVLVQEFQANDFKVKVLNARRFRYLHRTLFTIMRIIQIIRDERISVVFSNGGKEHIYGGIAAYFTRRPSVWLCQGASEVLDALTRIVSLIPTSLILADSAHTKSILLKYFRKPIKMVYSGIELIRLEDLSLDSTRKNFKLRSTTSLVTMVGLFMEWKGQEFFIRAVPRVLRQFPEAQFLLVGDATRDCDKPYARRLRMLVRKLNLESKIIFTGFREDRLSIMASSDVIVHASTSPEPFGLVITEAMAVGKPIVATNIGAPKEIIVDGTTGILIPPKDTDAIASACIRLLKDPGLRNKMGIAGRKRVEKYFTAERMTREIEKTLIILDEKRF